MEFLALVIEPDAHLRHIVRETLREEGWRVVEASATDEAEAIISQYKGWSLVYCAENPPTGGDVATADSNILGALRKRLGAAAYIVVMGVECDSDAVLRAIFNGASDYIQRPCRSDAVRKSARAVKRRLKAANKESVRSTLLIHPRVTEVGLPEPRLIGSSEAIINVYRKIAQSLAPHFSSRGNGYAERNIENISRSYFVTGETGTGKELVAQLIHRHSRYANGAFVAINCSALPAELAESELFGHEQGAFTGAVKEKQGLWEIAEGGTVFLDEITEAPLALQPKLLRVLQDRTIRRLGSVRSIPVDVQVVAASNRDLKKEIQAGRFREDLYHRLSLFHVHLPPLRERHEDIPLLVAHFAERYAPQPLRFSRDALDLLMHHSWAGNVRELENLVRAVTHAADGMIYAIDLLPRLQMTSEVKSCYRQSGVETTSKEGEGSPSTTAFLENQVKVFKLKMVKEALRQHRGNITRTAAALGMTRPTLYKLLKELDASDDTSSD